MNDGESIRLNADITCHLFEHTQGPRLQWSTTAKIPRVRDIQSKKRQFRATLEALIANQALNPDDTDASEADTRRACAAHRLRIPETFSCSKKN
jgi:hypothetical protein